MKTFSALSYRFKLRAVVVSFAAAALAASAVPAAATELSSTPLQGSSAAQVKPNIMLLMDASRSMGWGHMPDEVESITGSGSVGYKNAQCNVLYYNPNQAYVLPNTADGTPFTAPNFNAAPYTGFGFFAVPQDLSTVDLRSAFRAYDSNTLYQTFNVDTPQQAYYYTYAGSGTLKYDSAPCTDADTGATRTATDGGTWTRHLVDSTSGPGASDERQNFAIWYSFYRTRMNLAKSAASLAFTPLTNSFRVGFITVEPKAAPTATTIHQNKYVSIADFDLTQRGLWFNKLFSQAPFGASPAREGLARVGRYYAGKHDGINTGMDDDPMQYSCQQNFTILTTDGYWNAQTESVANGSALGGPVTIDGQHTVDQQDGDPDCALNSTYCPRPIWDGYAGSTHTDTDVSTLYADNTCALTLLYKTTFQNTAAQSQLQKTTTVTTQRTQQYTLTSAQNVATTAQTTKTVTQVAQTTAQYVLSTVQHIQDRYQVLKSQDQTTVHTEQYQQQTIQFKAQTSHVTKTQKQTTKTTEQYRSTTQQFVSTTTQFAQMQQQYTQGKVQTYKHQYQTIATDISQERQDALPGACTPSATIACSTNELFGPAPVDPANCSAGVGPAPSYIKTECTAGPMTAATAPVASCSPGTVNSGSPNYVVTTCSLTTTSALAPVASCALGSTTGASPNFIVTTCSNPAGANNAATPVASCTPGTVAATSGNSFVQTVCSVNNVPTFVASCTVGTVAGTSPNYVSVTCDKPAGANNTSRYVTSCSAVSPPVGPNFVKTTCSTATLFGPSVVDPATCSAGTGANSIITTCPSTNIAPYTSPTAVASCTPGTGPSPDYVVTTCTNPAGANNQTVFVASCTVGTVAGVTPNWITTTCTKPIDTTTFSPPCTSGTGANFIKTTCSAPAVLMPPTVVNPTSCTPNTGTTGPDYIVTHCVRQAVSNGPVGACVPGNTGAPNWIQTDCADVTGSNPVASCTPGTTNSGSPNFIQTTCTLTNPTVNVATCTPQTAGSGNGYVGITCAPMTVSGPAIVDPATCTAGVGPGPNFQTTTCTSAPAGPYASGTPVATCTNGTGPSPDFYVTTCSNPAATNFTNFVSSCSVGTVAGATPDWTTTTCSLSDTSVIASGPAPTYCTERTASAGNNWRTITCTTAAGVTNSPTDTCTPGPSTTCNTVPISPATPVGTCTSGTGAGPNYYITTCGTTTPSTPIADSGCVPGTGAAPDFLQTACTSGPGPGFQRVKTTTTKVTVTAYSGSTPAGTPTITTSTGLPTNVGVCTAAPAAMPSPNPEIAPTVTVSTPSAPGSLNSLADVAQYYYKTDLRPDNTTWPNNVPSIGAGLEDDNAPHQHMTTFTIGLGVSGTLEYDPRYRSPGLTTGDFAHIRTGTIPSGDTSGTGATRWPLWPDPAVDYTSTVAAASNWENRKSIDDFWHTAVDGRGTYFSATSPTDVVDGLNGALAGISSRLASSTGQGVSTGRPVPGNNFVYTATYTSGKWTGDVVGSTINLTTGVVETPPLWSAQALLDGKTAALCDSRTIYLTRSGATNGMVPFTWNTDACVAGAPSGSTTTQLNAAEQAYFAATQLSLHSQYPSMTTGASGTIDQRSAAVGDKLVNYVRGQRGYEPFVTNTATSFYRQRDHVLGDVVDSTPVYVKVPFAAYTDAGYDAFRAANAGRTPMVYVGANDGMLHAFYAGTDATDPQKGIEAWAIIPSAVLPNLYKLADINYRNVHQFYVDGTPTVADVYDSGTSTWKTILVNGLNNGGRAYFAVDVTDPAAPKTIWEFKWNPAVCPATPGLAVGNTADCHLGYTYGNPVVTKLSDGTWVVLVTSGYNNVNTPAKSGDGVGYLYVLNALTGQIISKISTGVGDSATPSGLAQINNFVDNALVNNTTVRAYGGDLLGNIWRFDINGTPSATLLGTATDPSSNPQPITVRPELAELNNQPIVLVGTGRFLGASDIGDLQVQSIWGITDPLTSGTVYSDLRASMKPLEMTQVGTPPTATRTVACPSTATAAQCAITNGWVVDLKDSGERVNVGMQLILGTLVVASNVPQDTACTSGGHSWVNFLNFSTGLAVTGSTDQVVSQYMADSLIVGLGVVALPPPTGMSNPNYVGLIQTGGGGGFPKPIPVGTPKPFGKRVTWREIPQ